MPKILVVDDEKDQELLITQLFKRKDYLQDYEFIFANNGLKGLEYIQLHADIDLALLDINMPEIDGLTLLEKIKDINPMIQVVIISAYGDMPNIRTAMNRGAFDFLNKPIEFNDLEATFIKTIREIKKIKAVELAKQEMIDLRQKAAELETRALKAQMNPHFIFNSLNSINNFILKNDKTQASEYLIKFAELIRMILEYSNKNVIHLEQEMEALTRYIDLEVLKFEQKPELKIIYDPELDLSSVKVPPLIFQPFIENALLHGLLHKVGQGKLIIEIKQVNDTLNVSITDNGIGRTRAKVLKKAEYNRESMGIALTTDRIALLKSSESQSQIIIHDLTTPAGESCGTQVNISIPLVL